MYSGKKGMKKLFSLLMTAMLLLAAGCAPHGDQNYQAVAKELDAGGQLYMIHDTSALHDATRAFAETIAVENVKSVRRRRVNILIANALLQASGLTDVKAWGMSSVASGDSAFPVKNTLFLRIDPTAPGALNRLLGSENPDIQQLLGALPQDVTAGFAINMRPQIIAELLKTFGPMGIGLLDRLPLDMEKILTNLNGVWVGAVILPHDMTDLHIGSCWVYLSLPDKDEFLFNTLAKIAELAKFKYNKEKKRISADDSFPAGFQPVVQFRNGRIEIYSSSLAENFFTAADTPRLKNSAEFARIQHRLPEKCCALWFSQPREFSRNNTRFGSDKSMGAISRTATGILLQGFSAASIDEYLVNSAYFLYHFFKTTGKQVKKSLPKAEKQPPPPQIPEKSLTACADSLRQAKGAIHGVKRLYYCPATRKIYVRFYGMSKLKSKAKLPVMMDRPDSHRGAFNVLFSDGSVETFHLKNQKNCRRMISFLQTTMHWQENIFRELMRQANEFDRNSK